MSHGSVPSFDLLYAAAALAGARPDDAAPEESVPGTLRGVELGRSEAGSVPRRLALIVASCLCALDGASAADGVSEINPSCAVQTGCFAGDAPGFPVEITRSGSYTLTGSLDLRSEPAPADATGILVSADFVSIDLNGFSIVGPFDCSGGPPGAPGSGDGIRTTASHVRVEGGIVRGVGRDGLSLGPDAAVDGVGVTCCGGDGVEAGSRARVTASHVTRCGGTGLSLGPGSGYGGNTLAENVGGAVSGSSLVELGANACDAGTLCLVEIGGVFTSNPPLSYSCAFGLVTYSVTQWTLAELGGGALSVDTDGLGLQLLGEVAACGG